MAHSPFNKSHYYDPTAKAALDNIDKQRVKPKSKFKSKSKGLEPEPMNRISSRLDNKTKRKLFLLTNEQKGEA